MITLKIYDKQEILSMVNTREGETKLGERVQSIAHPDELKSTTAKFVLLGIPEDIGVRANQGIGGATTAWKPALKALMNIQSNNFLHGEELLVLGAFEFPITESTDLQELQAEVSKIDDQVYPVIQKIIDAGKVPIIIGGGHNNAYPIIKGYALATKKPVDVINIDAHADLRKPEGRHSGNGFSYALKENYLKNYAIFGLHESYNNSAILAEIQENPNIYPVFFDALLKSNESFFTHFEKLCENLNDEIGLEIDLDCIENVLSSAITPSGFTINDIRRIILNSNKKFAYMHVCEGATKLADGRQQPLTAKVIAYLISDFIKAQVK